MVKRPSPSRGLEEAGNGVASSPKEQQGTHEWKCYRLPVVLNAAAYRGQHLPHFTDGHTEVSVTLMGLELMVSDSKSIVVFHLPATRKGLLQEELARAGNLSL